MKRSIRRAIVGMIIVLQATAATALAERRQTIREAVARVTLQPAGTPHQNESGKEGAAIGALTGGAIMATFFVVSFAKCGKGCENDLPGWLPAFGVGVGAAAGATAGYFIDKAHHSTRKVAVAPVVSRRGGRLNVAMRF
jgi:hypothetical protein